MAGTLKVAAGGPEMGVIPEEMYRRAWQRLAPVRPEPGLPSVADVFVNKAVQQRLVADRSGAFRTAFRQYEKGQFADSAATLRALLHSERKDWIAGYLLARAEVAAGDFEAGEQALEEWLAAQLEVPSVALLRIEIQTELALRCYDLVMSRQPDSIRAKMLRAKSYAASVQTDRAIGEYREVLKSHPDVPQIHLAIAQIYADELNWAAVIEELLQELELSPDNGMALALLGHAYAETENTAQAIPVLKKVLDRYPNDANALADLGKVWVRMGNPAKAIEAFERALRLDESQYKLHYRLYRLYGSMGQQELAQTHLKSFSEGEAKRRKPKMITNE